MPSVAGLEIHDGHVAFAIYGPGHCCNAPRIVYNLQYGHKLPANFLFGAAVPLEIGVKT